MRSDKAAYHSSSSAIIKCKRWLLHDEKTAACVYINQGWPWARGIFADVNTHTLVYCCYFSETHTYHSLPQSWGCWLPGKSLHLHSHEWHWFPSNRDEDVSEERKQAAISYMLSNYEWALQRIKIQERKTSPNLKRNVFKRCNKMTIFPDSSNFRLLFNVY